MTPPPLAGLTAIFLSAAPLSSAFTATSVSSTHFARQIASRSGCRNAAGVTKMAAMDEGHHTTGGTREAPADLKASSTAISRGGFFASLTAAALGGSTALGVLVAAPEGASANGMLDFPPARLNNRYFVMRSGQGGSDKEGLVQSHPVDKLHMTNRLTEQGIEETQRAASVLRGLGVSDAFIWADISSRAQDTARILAEELDIRQERVVPEYSFLEPRGMGIFDGKDVSSVLPVVYKEDAISGTWRPPPNTDGTPNESVNDVFVRVRQLMSKLETQYQGEDVIIVGADSDCLSVLQCFVLGEEMGKHSKYYLRPGEGRQLRTSLDTEVGYKSWREAKGNTVVSTDKGYGGEGA